MTDTASILVRMPIEAATERLSQSLARYGFVVTGSVGMRSLKESCDGTRIGGFRIISAKHGAIDDINGACCNILLSEVGRNAVKVATTDLLLPLAGPVRSALAAALGDL